MIKIYREKIRKQKVLQARIIYKNTVNIKERRSMLKRS